MTISDSSLLGLIIFLAQIVGKLSEHIIDRVLHGDSAKVVPPPPFPAHVEQGVARLVEWHDVRDPDGTFVWYFPKRTMLDRLDQIERSIQELEKNK